CADIVPLQRACDKLSESLSTGPCIELVDDRIGNNRGYSERETFDWIHASADHPGGFLRLLSRCTRLSREHLQTDKPIGAVQQRRLRAEYRLMVRIRHSRRKHRSKSSNAE